MTNSPSLLWWLCCSALFVDCQAHPPQVTAGVPTRGDNPYGAVESATAASADAESSAPALRGRAANASGVIEHRPGELPPHVLEGCVLHAGETVRWTKVAKTGPSTSEVPQTRSSCSFNSECGAKRGEGIRSSSTDGTVSIACEGGRCSCVLTTYAPPAVNRYTFLATDPCRDVTKLLRERCGG